MTEPTLHGNWLIASWQLLIWLFLRPSSWRQLVQQIGLGLSPDFCLVELEPTQWQRPLLRRVLGCMGFIYPFGSVIIAGLVLLALGRPIAEVFASMLTGFMVSLLTGILVSLALSVGGGIVVSFLGGLFGSISNSLLMESWLTPFLAYETANVLDRSLLLSFIAGMSASIIVNTLPAQWRYSLSRQMGGIVMSVLLSVMVVAAVTVVALLLSNREAIGIILGTGRSPVGVVLVGAIISVAAGLIFGLVVMMRGRWPIRRALLYGLGFGSGLALAFVFASDTMPPLLRRVGIGMLTGMVFTSLFILPYTIARLMAGSWAGAVAGTLGSIGIYVVLLLLLGDYGVLPILVACGVGIVLGLGFNGWRSLLFYPFEVIWNTAVQFMDEQRPTRSQRLLAWHSAFWDEQQRLSLPGLDQYLVWAVEQAPAEGQQAIATLMTSRQRWAAQTAQIELTARTLAACANVEAIAQVQQKLAVGELRGPAAALLRSFARQSQDVAAALQRTTAYHQRLAFRDVEDGLNRLLRELEQSSERYAPRFYPVAAAWHQLVWEHREQLTQMSELTQEIDNPYIFGIPLTETARLFVGRTDVSSRIEQLLRDARRPPLMLYGQRRMGKTSLLHNLGRLLPQTIVPLYVDGQGIAGAVDYGDLLYSLARQMGKSAQRHRGLILPSLSRVELAHSPFTAFNEWLDRVEDVLGDLVGFLTLDEFEALIMVMNKGRFDEQDLLNTLRHLIQHRTHFKVMLAGSHTLAEWQHWASYLINVQLIHLTYLQEAEARRLIEAPVQDFVLQYEPSAVDRLWQLTRGHPHLLQLLCYEIVSLKNEQMPQQRHVAVLADVETAVTEALEHGSFFFADIEREQVSKAGRQLLLVIAAEGEGVWLPTAQLATQFEAPFAEQGHLPVEKVLSRLQHREIIEIENGRCRFQVELIRRWFAR